MFLGIQNILGGISDVFTLSNLLVIAGGILLGQVVGAAPGLNAIMAIAIAVPLTFYMSPLAAIAFLLAVNKGGAFGGSVTAILVNTPGSPEAAATCLDGHPLAQKGQAEKALKVSLYSSIFGDTFSDLVLALVAAPLSVVALKMGPPEITTVILFSLTLIAAVAGRSLLIGLLAACFGFMMSLIGTDPIEGTSRLSFGIIELEDGIPLVSSAIGLLAVSEIFLQFEKKIAGHSHAVSRVASPKPADRQVSKREFKGILPAILRGSVIGTGIGILPGVGAVIASFISYGSAKRASKHQELFGKGSLEGIAAAESANNAVIGANLIPLFTLGIPGNVVAAILIGAFMIHGVIPGPTMFQDHGRLIAGIFTAMLLANLVNFLIARASLRVYAKTAFLPRSIVFPVILILCITGAYISENGMFGVIVMYACGLVGYFMAKFNISYVPFIIGYILGPIFETNLRQTLIISGGSLEIFFTRPLALAIIILTLISIVRFVWQRNKI